MFEETAPVVLLAGVVAGLRVKAGESYQIPAGEIHDAKAAGDKPLKVLAIYIVDKAKPLATPAP